LTASQAGAQAGSDEPGECGSKKKKGETVVEPQFHPKIIIPELKHFASAIFNSPNFRNFM